MEVYELCEAPENMAFYVHGQGHAIEHDSRQLIVRSKTLCRRFSFASWSSSRLERAQTVGGLGAVWLDGQAPKAGE